MPRTLTSGFTPPIRRRKPSARAGAGSEDPWFVVATVVVLLGLTAQAVFAAQLLEVGTLDRDYLVVHLADGEVVHDEGGAGETIIRHTPELDTSAAQTPANWTVSSVEDANYGGAGRHPSSCFRKTKLSGHAQMEWVSSDFRYESTYEHWIYLQLPSSLQQGAAYTLTIDGSTNSDTSSSSFTFDIYTSRSEAVHVNLVGYAATAPHKAADLYHWMGDGGARNYSSFEGNTVYIYNLSTEQATAAGSVSYWMADGSDAFGYDFTRSDVWNVDFSSFTSPGTYRLVVEGVGCSEDFEIADDVYDDPFVVSLRGYFYMRVGETNPTGISPPPRTPSYIPGTGSPATTVYLTTMQPWHPDWDSFSSGDVWDRPNDWAAYRKAGNPTNPNAWGGHSDAADWDRHLAHVVNIYDLLLPFLLSDGALSDDDTGITESGNGIPDLLDEARNEVDFWLRLRDGDGYSHGLTNPNDTNELFQAGPTAIAAWANAANAAMLADAFRLAGLPTYANQYRNDAVTAYTYADELADPMLDEGIGLDDGFLRGRDLKMMAAAHLYNLTGTTAYENVVATESVCAGGATDLINSSHHQAWATAAYLITPQTVHFPSLQADMKAAVVAEANSKEADLINSRPSRRATEIGTASFWRTAHAVGRTIIAHAVADDPQDLAHFRKALDLEADWGLGRNPLNIVEMSTAHTPLAELRNYEEVYTSGREDGIEGIHPGHTPYLNLTDWSSSMVMGRPSALYENSYPGNVPSAWPHGECYFPSRWVWAHTEFTPRQTMRGKMALYGYLYALAAAPPPPNPTLSVDNISIAGGSGSVSSLPTGIDCGADCSEAYANGTAVTLTATAAEGSVFTGWGGACFGAQATCQLSMTVNRSVSASFQPEGLLYTLTVSTAGNGSGTVSSLPAGIDCGADCSEDYLSGTLVELSATPESMSAFAGWSGACSGTGTCVVSMSSARSVTATFQSKFAPEVMVYEDALGSGWQNWSWDGSFDLAATSPARAGSTYVVNATLDGWGGFSAAQVNEAYEGSSYHSVRFWVHGGGGGDKSLGFFTQGQGGQSEHVAFTAVADTWTEITVTMDELGSPTDIDRLNFQNGVGSPIDTVSFDDIRLVPTGIFGDGFESSNSSAWE